MPATRCPTEPIRRGEGWARAASKRTAICHVIDAADLLAL